MTSSMAAAKPSRPDLLAPLLRDLDAAGGCGDLPVRGNSMRPILRDGDRVRVASVDRGIRLGDMVLRVEPGGPIIHRVVGWWPSQDGWRILTKGDGARRLDAPLALEDLAGRVTTRVRGDRVRRLDGTGMRMRGWIRAILSLIGGLVVELWDRARGRSRSEGA